MSDIHNLQVVISQSPKQSKIIHAQINGASNNSQIMNTVNQKKTEQKMKEVQKVSQDERINKSNRNDSKEQTKEGDQSKHKIDTYQ